jgi:putative FmdB family regulatory protein
MPTYQYECRRCGNVFERFQSIKDKPVKRCPECRGGVKRVPGAGAGIIFKGSGFYQTDYRSKGYGEAAKRDKAASEQKTEKPANKESAKKEG